MNYWYVARPNELFLDIDNPARSLKHAKARLQGAIECGKLDVLHVMQRPSASKNHLHVIVTLKPGHGFSQVKCSIWEIILHSDIYRGCCNTMRSLELHSAPRIIISPHNLFSYQDTKIFRFPDDKCNCKGKHSRSVMIKCPAAARLRGYNRAAGFFGKPSHNPCTVWPDDSVILTGEI